MFDMYFSEDETEMVEMKWDAVSFIDAMKMADEAWSCGANFDVDKNILSNVNPSTPIKISQSDTIEIGDQQMYVIWGMVEVENVDFDVAIRFYALPKTFEQCKFQWTTNEPTRMIDLSNYIQALEESEESKWASILGE